MIPNGIIQIAVSPLPRGSAPKGRGGLNMNALSADANHPKQFHSVSFADGKQFHAQSF